MAAVLVGAAVVTVLLAVVALTTFASPGWPFRALGLTLGGLPFAQLPGLPGTLVLLLVALCWCALATGAYRMPRPTKPVVLTALLLGTGALSLVATGLSGEAIPDYVRWAVASSVLVPVAVAGRGIQAALGRAFVYGATLAGAAGILLLRFDPAGRTVAGAGLVERDPFGGNLRAVRFADGSVGTRLTSVWLDPNVAGLMMTGALLLALALLRGKPRIVCAVVLTLAIALTLSRAAFGTLAVGGLLLVVASGLTGRTRGLLALLGAAVAGGLLLVPTVLTRLRESFGSSDVGTRARLDAIADLPEVMAGHWVFGRGWGLPELLEGSVARVSNYPANATLLTLYRGGVLMAIVFTALLVLLLVRGWRLLRQPTFEEAALGAGAISLVLVAFQLDFPVVTILPAVVLLGLLLVYTSPVRQRSP